MLCNIFMSNRSRDLDFMDRNTLCISHVFNAFRVSYVRPNYFVVFSWLPWYRLLCFIFLPVGDVLSRDVWHDELDATTV